MQPPCKGALPYTREEYRELPKEKKNAALDFIIEGIIPDTNRAETQKAMDAIVNWCIEHGEDAALEFLYRESGASRMRFVCKTLDQRAFMQMRLTLQSHPQVMLHFSHACIRDDAAPDIAELIRNRRIATLGINCASFSNESMCLIAQALLSDSTITELNLRRCKPLNRDTAKALGDALGKNTNIDHLHFSECDFGPQGWEALLSALQSNRHARKLTMEMCTLKSGGSAAAFGRLLANSVALKKFTLLIREFECIAKDILGGLGQSRSIEEAKILMCDGKFEQTKSALRDCIAHSSSLKELELNPVVSPPDLAQQFATSCMDAVASNTTLCALTFPRPAETKEEAIVNSALQRNAALANDAYVRKAAAIFSEQPSPALAWQPEGPSDMLLRHILMREKSLSNFADTMAHVELAVKEQTLQTPGHAAQ